MFVTVIALKYALLVSQWSYGHFLELTDSILSSPFHSAHYIVLYPQNGDLIVTVDSVTSFHPVYRTTRDETSVVRTEVRVVDLVFHRSVFTQRTEVGNTTNRRHRRRPVGLHRKHKHSPIYRKSSWVLVRWGNEMLFVAVVTKTIRAD